MSKKRRNLLLLAAATLLLVGLLWLLTRPAADVPATEEGHTHAVSEGDHTHTGLLIDAAQEDLQKIVFRNENAKYTAVIDGEKGEVVFRELKDFSVNSAFMEYVWYGVSGMTYSDIVTETDAPDYSAKAFGLDKPALTVTAYYKGGRKVEIRAGNTVPGSDGELYYTLVKGDRHVYACPIDTPFFMGDSYYLNDDVFYLYDEGIESGNITIGNITLRGNRFDGDFVMKECHENDPSSVFCGCDYEVTSPVHWPVQGAASSRLVYDLTYLMADEAAARNPSKSVIASYGLNHPTLTLEFTRNGKPCVMYCSQTDKETMYVMLKGGRVIYMLKRASLEILFDLSPETLYGSDAVNAAIEPLSGIAVRSKDVSLELTVTRTKNEKTLAESDAVYTYTVQANGGELKYSRYAAFVRQLNSSAIQRWNIEKPSGKADVTVTLTYFANFRNRKETLRFYRVTDREYAVVRDGLPVNTVSETWLNRLLQSASQL